MKFAKQRMREAGLPGHVVHMYLDQSTDRLTQRMKTIVRKALRSPQTTKQSTSTAIDATSTLITNKMQYVKRITPNERRMEVVKRKMENEFLASSSNSEEEEGQGSKKKKKKNRKIDVAKEAQEAHKKMCEKAKNTMDSVKSILSKVDLYLDKAKK